MAWRLWTGRQCTAFTGAASAFTGPTTTFTGAAPTLARTTSTFAGTTSTVTTAPAAFTATAAAFSATATAITTAPVWFTGDSHLARVWRVRLAPARAFLRRQAQRRENGATRCQNSQEEVPTIHRSSSRNVTEKPDRNRDISTSA